VPSFEDLPFCEPLDPLGEPLFDDPPFCEPLGPLGVPPEGPPVPALLDPRLPDPLLVLLDPAVRSAPVVLSKQG
jgi:hypothetical protein